MTGKKNTTNVTLLIVITCAFVVLSTVFSYFEFTNKLNKNLITLAASTLSSRNETFIQNYNNQLIAISEDLEDLSEPFISGSMNASEFVYSLSSNVYKNNFGTLEFFPIHYINENYTNPNISKMLTNAISIYAIEDSNKDESAIAISILLKINGSTVGALRSVYTLEEATNIFFSSAQNEMGFSLLMNGNGTVLLDESGTSGYNYFSNLKTADFSSSSSLPKLQEDILNNKTGVVKYTLEGNEYYAQFVSLETNSLYLYHTLPANKINDFSQPFFSLIASFVSKISLTITLFILLIVLLQFLNSKNMERNQEKLVLEKERYQSVLKHAQAALWEYQITSDIMTQSDPDLGIYTGLSEIPDYEKTMLSNQIIHPNDIEIFKEFCQNLRLGQNEIVAEFRATDISGNYEWFELTGTTLHDKNGTPVSVIGQSTNINQQRKELEALRNSANRDSLTNLFNRSALVRKINHCLESSEPTMIHGFYMIDIDNFKGINDNYGHTFGDAVLLDLSTRLGKHFKEPNIIGRLGGDEFVVFIPNLSSIEEGITHASKLSQLFRKFYSGKDSSYHVSGSIGISFYPNDGNDFLTLMKKADIALYHSKNLGKDCYSCYQDKMKDAVSLSEANVTHKTPLDNLEEHSLIDNSIFSNTFDILFTTKDKESAINIILSLIGNFYKLDILNIIEYTEDGTHANITFDWASNEEYRIPKTLSPIPMETLNVYTIYKNSPTGISFDDNLDLFSFVEKSPSDFFKKRHINGYFQCGFTNGKGQTGFISALLCNNTRTWKKSDIDSLSLLSKIVGSYLLGHRIQENADRLATKDPLTNAYTYIQFNKEAYNILSNNPTQSYAVIYFDINDFKYFNENFGYQEGDRILVEVAQCLENATESDEVFGRVIGDKFVGLFKYENNKTFTKRLKALNKKFNSISRTKTECYKLAVSIGIYPIQKSTNMAMNIDKANIARKYNKEFHKTTYSFYNESMRISIIKQKEIEDIMEEALLSGQFLVYYQPKINLNTHLICGAEALVRWNRPDIGIVQPMEFIPIFEENGFIIDIDFFVFEEVCKHFQKLLKNKAENIVPVSVNLSRLHLKNKDLPYRLESCVLHYGVPTNLIEIEITESAFVEDDEYLLPILNEIHKLGFKLSMDDFGTGLSSLNSLKKLPFDVLKLDKEFLQSSTATEREQIVITSIVKMAHDLQMEIVSEGVETKEQADFLTQINCHIAQGYLFAKPMPADEFEERFC